MSERRNAAAVFDPPPGRLRQVYDVLMTAYGYQAWWPAESAFEVAVGAVLTQNTAWKNVERAIARLRAADMLSLDALLASDIDQLAELLRPAGYYNLKARRLRNLCECLADRGGLVAFARLDAGTQRSCLLSVSGIGPETADDILLYALDRQVFVIDAYTRRLLVRLGLANGDESYEALRSGFERQLGADLLCYQQYHALIVEHAKRACRKTPDCTNCGLRGECAGPRQ